VSKRAFVLAPLLLCSALFVYGQSPKESILDALTSYQTRLAEVKLSILNYERQTLDLQSQIDALSSELAASKQSLTISEENLTMLRASLEKSRLDLEASRLALEKQETIYKELSTDLEALRRSYLASRRLTKILGLTSIAGACYITGNIAGWW